MDKLKPTELIKEFSASSKIDCSDWTTKVCDEMLFVSRLPTRQKADELARYLTGRGLVTSVIPGDRTGGTWQVLARQPRPSPSTPARRRYRRRRLGRED